MCLTTMQDLFKYIYGVYIQWDGAIHDNVDNIKPSHWKAPSLFIWDPCDIAPYIDIHLSLEVASQFG